MDHPARRASETTANLHAISMLRCKTRAQSVGEEPWFGLHRIHPLSDVPDSIAFPGNPARLNNGRRVLQEASHCNCMNFCSRAPALSIFAMPTLLARNRHRDRRKRIVEQEGRAEQGKHNARLQGQRDAQRPPIMHASTTSMRNCCLRSPRRRADRDAGSAFELGS